MRENQLEKTALRDMIKYLSWVSIFVCLAIFVMRYLVLSEPITSMVFALSFLVFGSISLIGIYKFNNYHIGKWSILTYFLIFHPFRIHDTGGLFSFGITWFFVILPFVVLFFSRKVVIAVAAWFSFILLYFAYKPVSLEAFHLEPEQLAARAFTYILGFFTINYFVSVGMKGKENLRDAVALAEGREALVETALRMAHEINNPLAIISLKSEMLVRKGVEAEELKPVLDSVERINKALEEFKILSSQEDRLSKKT